MQVNVEIKSCNESVREGCDEEGSLKDKGSGFAHPSSRVLRLRYRREFQWKERHGLGEGKLRGGREDPEVGRNLLRTVGVNSQRATRDEHVVSDRNEHESAARRHRVVSNRPLKKTCTKCGSSCRN